jgi:hypothetical protein
MRRSSSDLHTPSSKSPLEGAVWQAQLLQLFCSSMHRFAPEAPSAQANALAAWTSQLESKAASAESCTILPA